MFSHLNSHTLAVTTNVLSKSKHEITGCPLKVKQFQESMEDYEQDRIKINLANTVPPKRMKFYVAMQLDMDEEDLTLEEINDKSYILVFNSVHTIKGSILLVNG